jgi:hypothetical protein
MFDKMMADVSDPAVRTAMDALNTYESAYDNAWQPATRTYINMHYNELSEKLRGMLDEQTMQQLEEDPVGVKLRLEESVTMSDDLRNTVADYVAAKSAMDGINDRINDDAEAQAEQKRQQLRIVELHQAYIRLWLIVGIVLTVIILSGIMVYLFQQKKKHKTLISQANERLSSLTQELNQSNAEKEKREQEIRDFLKDKDNRQELETLTPAILQTEGETKFRQCFEILHPLFLPRLREKVPSITRREELLSMLILLKQDNKYIAELMSIAPRSVLMMRHRFRQKIGLDSELSLENFIEELQKENDEMEINNDEKEINKDESDNNTNQSITR